ncbi:ankyrin repeat domain-containing protein [Aspergillus tanneri]|uniref:Uncharacterized protein n=1 Tax=Aspergillus tanneri TaxID=1220188 RepID=A0A5M9MV68_9EURO|nr:uncharacterized protein ATNIH1004_003703 [Aspergillus tanneri]KAA8651012.1 hypothetical protein ATNIH1004_003703 [Aspergillus tanneri]
MVESLLGRGAGPNAEGQRRTALSWAVEKGNSQIAITLHDVGTDLDSSVRIGNRTRLSFAAENGHEKVVKMLRGHGADPDSKSPFGCSLLFVPKHGHLNLVQLLVEKGGDINIR